MARADCLSVRELQVVELVVDGLSNKAIAATLSLSDRTVQSHLANAMAKTETRTRTQLAVWALRSGSVSLNGSTESSD